MSDGAKTTTVCSIQGSGRVSLAQFGSSSRLDNPSRIAKVSHCGPGGAKLFDSQNGHANWSPLKIRRNGNYDNVSSLCLFK